MLGKVGEHLVDLWFIAAALGNGRFKVVGHQCPRHTAVEPQCVLGTADEVLELLAGTGLHVGILAAAQYADEHFQFLELPGVPVDNGELLARKIDEKLVAGLVLHPHHGGGLLLPFGVPVLEL